MDKPQKILIAGGTGLIGTALTNFFLRNGFDVSILSRTAKNKDLTTFLWDPSKMEIDTDAFMNQDFVVNLAGAGIADKFWTKKRKEEILESRINSVRLIAKGIGESGHKPLKVIQASAIGYYGNRPEEQLTEQSKKGAGFLSDVCASWELESGVFELMNISVAIVRIGVVLSKTGGYVSKIQKASKSGVNLIFGNGNQLVSWIHIDDLVSTFHHIIQNNLQGIYNAVSPNAISSYHMQKLIAQNAGLKTIDIRTNTWFIKLLMGSFSEVFLSGQHVVPQKLLDNAYKFGFPKTDVALKNIFH